MSKLTSNRMLAELEEFASFTAAEQRYIRRSLEVAFTRVRAVDHWARGLAEAAGIGLQAKTYDIIEEIRTLLGQDIAPYDATSVLPLLIRMSAFDIQQGKLASFAAYRFLYERLLGAAVRPWLVSAFCAAAALPSIHPEFRAELIQSLTLNDVAASRWGSREALFCPEWIEKVPLAAV